MSNHADIPFAPGWAALNPIRRLILEGSTHPDVVTFARRCLHLAGYPLRETTARTIVKALRELAPTWHPDPTREFLPAAHLLVPKIELDAPVIDAMDADTWATLLGACLLAVGVEGVELVGLGYGPPERGISNVVIQVRSPLYGLESFPRNPNEKGPEPTVTVRLPLSEEGPGK